MTPSARPMERFFNIAAPCIPGKRCMLPSLDRMPVIRRPVACGGSDRVNPWKVLVP